MLHILVSLFIGALVGWIAGKIMDSKGGLLRNMVLGIVGGMLGGWLGSLIGVSGDYSRMVFNEGTTNEFYAWVNSQYVAPVIN